MGNAMGKKRMVPDTSESEEEERFSSPSTPLRVRTRRRSTRLSTRLRRRTSARITRLRKEPKCLLFLCIPCSPPNRHRPRSFSSCRHLPHFFVVFNYWYSLSFFLSFQLRVSPRNNSDCSKFSVWPKIGVSLFCVCRGPQHVSLSPFYPSPSLPSPLFPLCLLNAFFITSVPFSIISKCMSFFVRPKIC